MMSICDESPDLSEYAEQIPGLYYPTHEAFTPTRRILVLTDEFVLYSLYDDVEETDCQASVAGDLEVIEKIGGLPKIVHTVDPITNLHSFYIYVKHPDRRLMERYEDMTAASHPEIPSV